MHEAARARAAASMRVAVPRRSSGPKGRDAASVLIQSGIGTRAGSVIRASYSLRRNATAADTLDSCEQAGTHLYDPPGPDPLRQLRAAGTAQHRRAGSGAGREPDTGPRGPAPP